MNDQDTQEKQEVGQETPDSVAISDTQDTDPNPQEIQAATEAPEAQAADTTEGAADTTQETADTTQEPTGTTQEPLDTTQEAPAATQEAADTTEEKPQEAEEKKGFGEILDAFEQDAPKKREAPTVGGKV
ncbi:MAG TPA: hypothetical protein VIJ61_02170, partial [Thermoanaerobaculia bacterium]